MRGILGGHHIEAAVGEEIPIQDHDHGRGLPRHGTPGVIGIGRGQVLRGHQDETGTGGGHGREMIRAGRRVSGVLVLETAPGTIVAVLRHSLEIHPGSRHHPKTTLAVHRLRPGTTHPADPRQTAKDLRPHAKGRRRRN